MTACTISRIIQDGTLISMRIMVGFLCQGKDGRLFLVSFSLIWRDRERECCLINARRSRERKLSIIITMGQAETPMFIRAQVDSSMLLCPWKWGWRAVSHSMRSYVVIRRTIYIWPNVKLKCITRNRILQRTTLTLATCNRNPLK